MARQLDRVLSVFGQSSTRLFIVDCISKNGNSINKEDLIEKVMSQTQVQRQSVRKHLRKMVEKGELVMAGEVVTLRDPVQVIPAPWESWSIIGIPLAIIFLSWAILNEIFPGLFSFMRVNFIFIFAMSILTVYCLAVNARDIFAYFKRIRRT